jgi:hypothetical protein
MQRFHCRIGFGENWMKKFLSLPGCICLVALGSCGLSIGDNSSETFPEFKASEPTGEGMELVPSVDKSLFSTPKIDVSDKWSVSERRDMRALVDTSIAIMMEPRFSEYATSLVDEYPKVWFSETLRYGDSRLVGSYVQSPPEPARYLPATVRPSYRWAITSGRKGNININVNRELLKRWMSTDPVMRACAVNTMSHEISHTISRSSERYLPAFTDTDVGQEARETPPASYLTGNIALCSYLINEGRINKSALKSCVAIWYKPGGFQNKRCDDFPGNAAVE